MQLRVSSRGAALQASGAKSCMPPKALSEVAERGADWMEDTVTVDERVGLFTPDKDRCTADGMGRAAVIAARRGTVCGEVGRVLRFPSTQHPHITDHPTKDLPKLPFRANKHTKSAQVAEDTIPA